MEKILNSIEELYQLIAGTLPEGYLECANCDRIVVEQHGAYIHPTGYFIITDLVPHDRVKIEYGKNYKRIITDGKIYKYA